jgi:phosphomannomutase
MIKAQLPLTTRQVPELLTSLQRIYGDGRLDLSDGLRVDWPNRWFHVRVSQTEPVIRVICEGLEEPPKELFDALLDHVRSFAE